MSRWRKVLGIGCAVVAAMGVGAAWAGGGSDLPSPQQASRVRPRATTFSTNPEARYIAIAPCRLVDTRLHGGQLAAGSVRGYHAIGTGGAFAAQGGKANGCGIPPAATAIQASVAAVSPLGTGYLRLYPGNGAEPTATFLNFLKSVNITGAGSVTICNGCGTFGNDFRVKGYQNPTHVVIDVQGYFVRPSWAVINANTTVARGSRVVDVLQSSGPGAYVVQFDHELTGCGVVATVGDANYGPVDGYAEARLSNAGADRVYVATRDNAGTIAARPFHLFVEC